MAQMASPSVVNISAVRVSGKKDSLPFGDLFGEDNPLNEFFKRFFGDQMPRDFKQSSLGSGFIIDTGGFILTNNHVVEKAGEIQVTLSDGKQFEAKVVGRDPKTDIALILIKAGTPLMPLPLGDSDQAEVGEWVLAIGSPFGLGNSVTAGIVSAKYRKIGAGPYDDFIQTDASINPGNSGGPLLNTKGEVIGINTAIFSQSGGSIGIGFAIPINMAKDLLPQLKKGEVIRGWLGVRIQGVTPDLAHKFGLAEAKGALVSEVTEDGPAEKSGITRGDVIISFDGKEIKKMADLPYMVGATPVGKTVKVEIIRKGKSRTLEVKVEEMKNQA
jgi:serine protease Do